MKQCANCKIKSQCFYRGIIDPCPDWRPDSSVKLMQEKVKACLAKPLAFWEGRFLRSMTKRQAYTTPMIIIIDQIFVR